MYVYKTTNLLTGRRYIGSCTRPINKSKNYFGGNGQLKKDIKEFGKKNFVKEILWQTEDFDELQEMEVRIIKEVNACKDDAWYNKQEKYGICSYGTTFSDEHKKKIGLSSSKTQKAAMTKEARKNLSDKLKGKAKTKCKHPGVSQMKNGYWRARHGTKYLGCNKDYDAVVRLHKDYTDKLNKKDK